MKLLVVLSRIPWPLDKGDKLRAFYQIKQLSLNHDIELVALYNKEPNYRAFEELSKYCKKVHFFKLTKWSIFINIVKAFLQGKPLQVGYFYRNSIHRKIQAIIQSSKPNHIYGQLVRVAEYIRNEEVPKTLDYQDALSAGLERRKEYVNGLKKCLFSFENVRLAKYEASVFTDFDYKTIITKEDRDLIQHEDNQQILVVPNGVDMEFFHPMDQPKIYDLVFTGNMNYPPNVMAAKFLVQDILPLVHNKKPKAKVLIAGASPSPVVRSLASELVEVTGWMDDIRNAYASSRVFIAPMQIGTGLQNKLLEAMAMKVPSVTSDLANAALKANEQTEIKVAPSHEKAVFAEKVLELLQNKDKAKEQANQAHEFILKTYSWKSSVQILESIWK